jgi:hypothetical protein
MFHAWGRHDGLFFSSAGYESDIVPGEEMSLNLADVHRSFPVLSVIRFRRGIINIFQEICMEYANNI